MTASRLNCVLPPHSWENAEAPAGFQAEQALNSSSNRSPFTHRLTNPPCLAVCPLSPPGSSAHCTSPPAAPDTPSTRSSAPRPGHRWFRVARCAGGSLLVTAFKHSPVESRFTEYVLFGETFCSRELDYFLDNLKLAVVAGAEDEAGDGC